MQVILASRSPRRQELLKLIVPDFSVQVSFFDEEPIMKAGLSPEETVLALSKGKAQAVAAQVRTEQTWIIAGDTVVVAPSGQILGIPRDKDDARRMMNLLAGNTHRVVTGMTVIGAETNAFVTSTDVTFYPLTAQEIENYISTDEPYDKAGGYGIQGFGSVLVEYVNGDYFNVVGLPVARLARVLHSLWQENAKTD